MFAQLAAPAVLATPLLPGYARTEACPLVAAKGHPDPRCPRPRTSLAPRPLAIRGRGGGGLADAGPRAPRGLGSQKFLVGGQIIIIIAISPSKMILYFKTHNHGNAM